MSGAGFFVTVGLVRRTPRTLLLESVDVASSVPHRFLERAVAMAPSTESQFQPRGRLWSLPSESPAGFNPSGAVVDERYDLTA